MACSASHHIEGRPSSSVSLWPARVTALGGSALQPAQLPYPLKQKRIAVPALHGVPRTPTHLSLFNSRMGCHLSALDAANVTYLYPLDV